jgi:hypothetical protein
LTSGTTTIYWGPDPGSNEIPVLRHQPNLEGGDSGMPAKKKTTAKKATKKKK